MGDERTYAHGLWLMAGLLRADIKDRQLFLHISSTLRAMPLSERARAGNVVGMSSDRVQALTLLMCTFARLEYSDRETYESMAEALLLLDKRVLHAQVRCLCVNKHRCVVFVSINTGVLSLRQ